MTSLFWAMLTLGRIVLGATADRVGVERLLRLSMIGVMIAAILFIFKNVVIGFIAVALMGFSLSAIFPTLTADTPKRVGLRHAPNTIGLQTGSASVGFAILPGLAGILAQRLGLETLGPFLIAASFLMFLTNEFVVQVMKRNRASESGIIPNPLGD
jgi:fucose permease